MSASLDKLNKRLADLDEKRPGILERKKAAIEHFDRVLADHDSKRANLVEQIAQAEQALNSGPTPQQKMIQEARERGALALRLRAEGKTYADIGRLFGVTGGRAKDIVMKAERLTRQGKP